MRVFLTDDDLDVNISTGPRFVIRGTRGHAGMPRRTRSNAEEVIRANRNARWRYLLRNRDFQRDVNLIRAGLLDRSYEGQRQAERIAKRWSARGIYVPTVAWSSAFSWQQVPVLSPRTIPLYEPLLDNDSWALTEAFSAYDPGNPEEDTYVGRPGQFREFSVSLDAPLDVIMALIEQDLREAKAHRGEVPRRWRAEKADFYLTVFDEAVEGKSFRDIAATLHKPVSTVKTAFLVACEHISATSVSHTMSVAESFANAHAAPESLQPGSARTFPSKSRLPVVSMDSDTHMETCRACRRANSAEELCSQARAYINQDARSESQAS